MVQRVATVAFEGIEVRPVDVQVQVAPGMPAFAIVGLPDKAVSEARERVRSALIASGLTLPARCITINLAPADLPKEGTRCGSRRAAIIACCALRARSPISTAPTQSAACIWRRLCPIVRLPTRSGAPLRGSAATDNFRSRLCAPSSLR